MIRDSCYAFYIYRQNRDISSGLFFFQAEDGIRDLVRSRGLGDVYKRQAVYVDFENLALGVQDTKAGRFEIEIVLKRILEKAVSYTHLTLPTSDLV